MLLKTDGMLWRWGGNGSMLLKTDGMLFWIIIFRYVDFLTLLNVLFDIFKKFGFGVKLGYWVIHMNRGLTPFMNLFKYQYITFDKDNFTTY
jgi:hypothetical protein